MTTEMNPKVPRRRRRRLNEVLISTLVARIVAGEYESGDRLPTEAVLGDEFDVSRTVVREAAKVLEDKGLVLICQGQGCTVLPREQWRVMDSDIIAAQLEHDPDGHVFEDFTFVREALECEMAARAALFVTPDFERRGGELLKLAAAHEAEPDVFLEFDYAFHELIAEASGSIIAFGLMKTLRQALHAMRRRTNQIPGTIEHGQNAHEQIFRAITSGNSEGARQQMRDHLEWLKSQMRRGGLIGSKRLLHSARSGDTRPTVGPPTSSRESAPPTDHIGSRVGAGSVPAPLRGPSDGNRG